jgi:pyruvate dehydrogenase phosphatase
MMAEESRLYRSTSALDSTSFLNAGDVQMAGGAAGEDRVQAVCSEEHGWLFCGVYDGFNGRDAADFLAGMLYENIGLHLRALEQRLHQEETDGEDRIDNVSCPETQNPNFVDPVLYISLPCYAHHVQ